MKRTLLCIHVMPHEFEMFERWIGDLRRSLALLSATDRLVLRASLNLNPKLTDWQSSSLSPDYFVNRFIELTNGIVNINEIRSDDSLMGTTQQRRESIAFDYDQFIFADADLAFPPHFIKSELDASYPLAGKFIMYPSMVRLWDDTWDSIVHREFLSKPLNYHLTHDPDLTRIQTHQMIRAKNVEGLKFSGGWFTLYSREFFDFFGIPEALGGYGAEDTYLGFASVIARNEGHRIDAYILEGVYVSEDYIHRDNTLNGRIKLFDIRPELRAQAEACLPDELNKFAARALGKNLAFSFGRYVP